MPRPRILSSWSGWTTLAFLAAATAAQAAPVKTDGGLVEGITSKDGEVRIFEGIPYAAPPVGNLRWRAPQPVAPWTGVRKAASFGHRCMQGHPYSDMVFRDTPSEDCLYLNVWEPASASAAKLPVMVWIHGGGFQAGSASEPRQDGEHLARKGVLVVGINYRLGVFGFLAHPGLAAESAHAAAGNYGMLDMVAALRWVKRNIGAFGGDPSNVTIFGESAGSFAVSALMASPLAQGLFQRAIGESGAFFGADGVSFPMATLAASEKAGEEFAAALGAKDVAAMRALPADEVLKAAGTGPFTRFWPNVDGDFLPEPVRDIFAAGKQSHVPLLAGWNADEIRASVTLAPEKPTAKTFPEHLRQRFGAAADTLLRVYPAASDAQALESAASLASDFFVGYVTWKWLDMQTETGDAPVFRYSFDREVPVPPDNKVNGHPATAHDLGARHAGEIEYVFGTLDWSPKVPWEPVDRRISEQMMSYWTRFAAAGNPNGSGQPEWPAYTKAGQYPVMHFGAATGARPDAHRARYEALDALAAKAGGKP